MSKIIHNLSISLDEDLTAKLQQLVPNYQSHKILRQSLDARRRKKTINFIYSVEVFCQGDVLTESYDTVPLETVKWNHRPPVIVGAGPSGLFAALRFVERGVPCILIERGSSVEKRLIKINRFWRYGDLDPDNNVCFGEGGAGLYSDGKLMTRIRSDYSQYVLKRLVDYGAPQEILWFSNPHVGSDRIRRLIPKIRQYLLGKGCEIHFESRMTELLIQDKQIIGLKCQNGKTFFSNHVILATGHSASDVLFHLLDQGVCVDGQSFAVGLRIEHPQFEINQLQYRQFANHPRLQSASYSLSHHDHKHGFGVYSFCMCPGGYIISSGTEDDGIVSNGMSNFKRNSYFANAAIVTSIDYKSLFGNSPVAGLKFRQNLERMAKSLVFECGGKQQLPTQNVLDFLAKRSGSISITSSPSKAIATRLDQIFSKQIYQNLCIGLENFELKMPGFISPKAQLLGVETRTSCPWRITRNVNTLCSISHSGLYPCGEGAGYAGGITSSAVDGVRVAEAILDCT